MQLPVAKSRPSSSKSRLVLKKLEREKKDAKEDDEEECESLNFGNRSFHRLSPTFKGQKSDGIGSPDSVDLSDISKEIQLPLRSKLCLQKHVFPSDRQRRETEQARTYFYDVFSKL